MCEPTTIMLAMTAVAGAISAKGAYDQGKIAEQTGRNNQIMAEYAAQDAQRRGEEQAIQARRQGDRIKGAARANMAAKGLDLSSGTAAELQDQTDFFSESDQITARDNAAREVWSARAGGANAMAQGRAASQQANLQAFGTVLSTGAQVAGKWGSFTGAPTGGGDPTGARFSATGASIRARR